MKKHEIRDAASRGDATCLRRHAPTGARAQTGRRDGPLLGDGAASLGRRSYVISDNLTYAASIAYYYGSCRCFRSFSSRSRSSAMPPTDAENRNAVLTFVLQYFPAQFDFITEQLDAFRGSQLTLGVAGTLALVWGALGVFGATSTAVNYAWGVEEPRGFWKHKLFSFVMLRGGRP